MADVGPAIPAEISARLEAESEKRNLNEPEIDEPVAKKRKAVNVAELNLLENLPAADRYERSYMHRDQVGFVHCTKTFFLITASYDGHIKFWKKREGQCSTDFDVNPHAVGI